jgi:hypothetical protein
LAANQVTAQNEEKIDADPPPAIDAPSCRKAHDTGVINDDDNNRQGAEKVEARLTFAILEARINSYCRQ